MDYSKYENKVEYPNMAILKAYEDKITQELLNTTATGKELKKMFDEIPERVRKYKVNINNKYQKENCRLYMQFREDALEEAGLSDLPEEIQGRIFAKAWGEGHSCGYSEVFNCLLEYSELFEGYTMTKIE